MSEILSPCCSVNNQGLLWALNNTEEPVILSATEVQTYFDLLYNISHDFDNKRELYSD